MTTTEQDATMTPAAEKLARDAALAYGAAAAKAGERARLWVATMERAQDTGVSRSDLVRIIGDGADRAGVHPADLSRELRPFWG